MKLRTGFVSNSSSSSFVIMNNGKKTIPSFLKEHGGILKIPQTFGGETEFGRQRQNYDDFGSRLNFAVIMALHIQKCYGELISNKKSYVDEVYEKGDLIKKHFADLSLLYEVLNNIKDIQHIENNITLEYDDENGKIHGYIDHGSLWFENEKNLTDIFGVNPNKDSIYNWLFGNNIIANRSDEYPDRNCEIVDNRYDYL